MTIQGGGGGRKVPPGGSPKLNSAERPAVTSSSTPSSATSSSPPTAAAAKTSGDGFEHGKAIDPRLSSERAALPPLMEHGTTSGIDSTIRLLEARRDEILDEHRTLREKAWKLVGELARGGFERAVVDQRRNELAELRQRLAQQRRRLQQIQRRLKTAMQKSAKHGDLDLSRAIQAHLEKLKKLEPGVQKALVALTAMEHAFAGSVDAHGRSGGSVTPAPGGDAAAAHGDALAAVAPGGVVAGAVAGLLARGPGGSSSASSSSSSSSSSSLVAPATTPAPVLGGLQSFAEQILSSL